MNKLLASVALVAMAGTAHAQGMGSGNTYDPARDEIGVVRDGTFEGYVTLGSYDDYWATQAELNDVASDVGDNAATLSTLDPSAFAADGDTDPANELYDDTAITAAVDAAQADIDAHVAADLDTTADAFTSTGGTVVNNGTPDALDLDVSPAIADGAADGATALAGQAAQDIAIAAAQADADAAQAKADANALEIAAHIPSSVTNNGDGTCTHDNGDGVTTDYYCVGLLANDDVYASPELPLREASIISPLSGDFIAAGLASQAISNRADVTVTVNPDGTHTVTPAASACAAGVWSYDYTVTDADGNTDTATVTGIVDNTPVEKLRTVTNTTGTLHNLALVLTNGGTYEVDWGDGNVSAGSPSSTALYAENTYAAAYSGPIVVTAPACEEITQIRMTAGGYTGDLSALLRQVPDLTFFSWGGQNTGGGDISTALAFVPNLTFFSWGGQNTGTFSSTAWGAASANYRLFVLFGAAKSTADVDNALVALTNVASWAGEKAVNVAGSNAAPSAIGNAAIPTIIANGASAVITN